MATTQLLLPKQIQTRGLHGRALIVHTSGGAAIAPDFVCVLDLQVSLIRHLAPAGAPAGAA